MKYDCGETEEEKWVRLSTPHRFFAVLPVKIADHDCRFFEYVLRHKMPNTTDWSAPENQRNYGYWVYTAIRK